MSHLSPIFWFFLFFLVWMFFFFCLVLLEFSGLSLVRS